MTRFFLRSLALVLRLAWLAAITLVIGLVVVAQAAPRDGRSMFIVRGGSMEPSIPLGALIVVVPTSADRLAVGDVVSLRRGGVTVTHRIIAIDTQSGEPRFQLQGDANANPDPMLATPAELLGRVALSVPLAGVLMYFLGEPAGIVAVLSFMGSLLLARWNIDDLLKGRRRTSFPSAPEAAVPALG